jgi:signal-transduction protein with cAMP-binding, CBS, and nucleotidyltransferase domain
VAAQGRDPADTPVREVMTPKPDTLRSIDFISYAINRMGGMGYRHVPIVDEGKVKAVLSVRDVMLHLVDLLAEVAGPESSAGEPLVTEWTDLGGG